MSDPLIDSLSRAVEAAPDDVRLRTHLAGLLVSAGRGPEAVTHCAIALQHDPADEDARALMSRALMKPDPAPERGCPEDGGADGAPAPSEPETPAASGRAQNADASPGEPDDAPSQSPAASERTPPVDFDWHQAEKDLDIGPAAPFEPGGEIGARPVPVPVNPDKSGDPTDWDVETADVTLADVGGMSNVKDRLLASFLAPMRNPELRRLYGKSLRGGLLLYGPPGTGKTFIARAVAGEMGAGFLSVSITDILDPYTGKSEINLHNIFQQARDHSPCVLFLDELDAIGLKRSMMTYSAGLRGVVNQLLEELDGIGADNEGVYLLAATNAPWDIDPALRRPGRLDRAILVLPPDEPARTAILHTHLRDRPVEGIDLRGLARATEGLTGADLSHLCDSAAEKALMDSVRTGAPRMITMVDMRAALREIRPSTGPWFDTARNVVEYADTSGEYAELRAWMKEHKLL